MERSSLVDVPEDEWQSESDGGGDDADDDEEDDALGDSNALM